MKEVQRESMLFQRKVLGILCMLLAPTSILFGLIGKDVNLPSWYDSISATYYANNKIIMIGLLYAIGIFFTAYKGYDWKDRVCSIVQAATSFMIVTFPCATSGAPSKVGLFLLPQSTSNIIHCIGASVLFITFAFNVLFLFRLCGPEPTERKKLRNKIYLVCGIIIAVFMTLQAIYSVTSLFDFMPKWFPITWFNEFVMLEAFGFAYLVKSEAISKLNDE